MSAEHLHFSLLLTLLLSLCPYCSSISRWWVLILNGDCMIVVLYCFQIVKSKSVDSYQIFNSLQKKDSEISKSFRAVIF